MAVHFDHQKPFDCSTNHKSEPVVIPNYITLSVIWQITSGTREKNKHKTHFFIHNESARVRGFMRKAKFIPRGITGNRYLGGGVNYCDHIFYGLGSIVDQGMFRNTT